MQFVIKALATGFGIGYLPALSGTVGTLLGIPLFLGLSHLNLPLYFLTVAVFTLFSVWVTDRALPLYHDAKKPGDPGHIVIDEVAGFLWTAGVLRFAAFWDPHEGTLSFLILAFAFFRFFDITKWWLVGRVERGMKGAVGVVMDDVVAGIFGAVAAILFCIIYPLAVYLFVS